MVALKYWDVTQGAYVLLAGPTGPQGPQGLAGASPTNSVQVVAGGGWVGSAPPAGTKLKIWSGTFTGTAPGTGLNLIDITAAAFAYGYVPMVVAGDAVGSTNSVGCSVNYASTLTQLSAYVWSSTGLYSTGTVRIEYMLLGA